MTGMAAHEAGTTERPTLAYVVHSLSAGGTEKLVVEMSAAFDSQFTVHVLCLDEPGIWARDLRNRGIPVECLWRQPGLDLLLPVRLAAALRRRGADIIHAHQCTPWFYSALSRLFYRKPRLLLQEHGRFFPEADKPLRRAVNRMLIRRLTHAFVAVSEDVRRRLARYEGLDQSWITVVYNGTRAAPPLSAADRRRMRSDLGLGGEDFVVGTVGRFDGIKNLPMLVRAIAAASQRLPSLRGLLVGDGEELEPVRSLIRSLGLEGRVLLTGFREDARRITQCMDLFALSSYSEGTSMALLEATAAGVPVVVTAVGGNPEVVLEGQTGWLVPTGAVEALSAAIIEAAGAPKLRQERAQAGQRRFAQQFSFEGMIASYMGIYRSLVSRPG